MSSNKILKPKPRIALFFSGSGSTVQALLDQVETLNIVLTISSKKNALGCLRSNRQGLVNKVFQFPSDFGPVLELLKQRSINTILLVGFMKIIPADFIESFKRMSPNHRIFNIHPSILPDFKGLRSVERAFTDKRDLGVTIHDVVDQVDSGGYFQRLKKCSGIELARLGLAEAFLWGRSGEQQILKTWGSSFS